MINYWDDLQAIRRKRPLVHHLMNYVVMNDAANVTLAVGASPIMAHAREEVEELAAKADVLYINIGTLDDRWVESFILAGKAASRNNVPVLLDPVGAGATRFRTETVLRILDEVEVGVLKGNGGEMMALAGVAGMIKGVDSLGEASPEIAERLAREYGVTAVITGPRDYVSDGKRVAIVSNGTPMLQYITGSGCMVGSVIASFMAVNRDFLIASVEGLVTFEIAAEKAERKSSGPASLKVNLIDELYNMKPSDYEMARVELRG
ncbi:hydroxyethylthiazole kinase [Vulcanisaeta distributa]|uniref:Hydroxyethylthiazole kinase n=1 Tax=Vulcanisaeta distributa (strain DSM 14429 / JCM 11212 / NBRC 100878 / IC-017) TaxID=572478 RepID=E1QTZ8_VULDI|nr:hydroxyethylthiazole kinase [Vulcanisaeta distributa]ADN49795.1 Hydroxyethylthiazole kinase [Vulcanisaeta distributa DSM 14429]